MNNSLLSHTKNTRPIMDGSFQYIRSDVPTVLSAEDREFLIAQNIRTIIDLRETSEQLRKSCPLHHDPEFVYLSLPVTGGGAIPETPEKVADSYIRMVDDAMEAIIRTILGAQTNVLYFCNAGKDRTGVVTAILLHQLGVNNGYIIQDYLRSGENLKADLLRFAQTHPEVNPDVITPKAEYMERFLDWYCGRFST